MLQFHDIIIKDTFHRLESRGEKWLHHSTFGMTHKEERGENDQFILRLLLEQTWAPLLDIPPPSHVARRFNSSYSLWRIGILPKVYKQKTTTGLTIVFRQEIELLNISEIERRM